MFELRDRQFSELVYDVFGTQIQELGFEFCEENKGLVFARKGDIQLVFRLEVAFQVYLFSLEITLLGELGEMATPESYYRNLAVSTIARYSDPDYKISSINPSTENELREAMEIQKGELLKYCKDILNGDVTLWLKVVEFLIKRRSRFNIQKR